MSPALPPPYPTESANRYLAGGRVSVTTSRPGTTSDEQRDDARCHERPRPQQVDVEPGTLEYHHVELLVDHDRYQAHHHEHSQGVQPYRRKVSEYRRSGRSGSMGGVIRVAVHPLHRLGWGRELQQHRDEHEARPLGT